MSLATRCPACNTVFRVVPDQLKVSAGWVRCGRCGEVFDASKSLFALDAAGLPAPPAAAPPTEPLAPLPAQALQAAPPIAAANDGQAPTTPSSASPPAADTAPTPPVAPAAPAAAGASVGPAATRAGAEPATAAECPAEAPAEPTPADVAAPVPGFLLRAQRAEAARRRPQGPYALLALALLLLLGGQIAWHYRDLFAATWPQTRPPLQAACRVMGCELRAPLRIEAFTVESAVLRRIDESPMHLLQVVVRNRAPTDARLPAIDLALTDLQGRTTARRTIEARDLGAPGDHLPPQGEVALQALLDLGDTRVAGYTVELFYP